MDSLAEFIRSPITALVLTFLLAAFAPLSGRLSVRLSKSFIWTAALVILIRFSQGQEISGLSWFHWLVAVGGFGGTLAICSYIAGRALEPRFPDVFLFRHSSAFTRRRKRKLRKSLGEFRAYFMNLGFELSSRKLPIGIGGRGTTFSTDDALVGASMTVLPEQIDDLIEVTHAYAEYVILKALSLPGGVMRPPISRRSTDSGTKHQSRSRAGSSKLFYLEFLG